jgi:hypothetical protein
MDTQTPASRICLRCGKRFEGEGTECPDCAAASGLRGLGHSLIYLVALAALLALTVLIRRW